MGKDKSQLRTEYKLIGENQSAQNDWQAAQNAVDRAWQEEEWLRQFNAETQRQDELFDKETRRWFDQFNAQNEYNSPKSEVARLMAAGINPSVAAAGGAAGNSGASLSSGTSSSPSPSTPAGHGVSPAAAPHFASISNAAQMFSSVAQLNESLAAMAKSGSDISVEQRKVKPVIDNVIADTQNKQANKALTDTLNGIQTAFGNDKMAAEIMRDLNQAEALSAQGKQSESQALYNKALTAYTSQKSWQENDSYPTVLANLKQYGQTLKSQQAANYASVESYVAQAGLSRQQAAHFEQLARSEKFWNDANELFKDEIYGHHGRQAIMSADKDKVEQLLLRNGYSRESFKDEHEWLNYVEACSSLLDDAISTGKLGAQFWIGKGLLK